jgi:hypothetical protein
MTALARLGGAGAKSGTARARLADLLAAFSEGFDTADLLEARRLVEDEPRAPTSRTSGKRSGCR